jgi:mRNA-degrading endonuclease toxin of MazEF toxin-antitoxin module
VVQSDVLNRALQETIIVEITSNLTHATMSHQVLIDLATKDGAGSGLIMNSAVRCNRLHIIPQADVRSIIGRLSTNLMRSVEAALKSVLEIP